MRMFRPLFPLLAALCGCLVCAFGQDDPVARIVEYSQLLKRNPASSLAHYRLAEAYLQESNYQSAANEFREALNGDLEPKWTEVWAHIHLAGIFDVTGQHARAINEYQQAQQTGDNTDGALDRAKNYLEHAKSAIYLTAAPGPWLNGAPIGEPIQKTEPEYSDEARVAELEGTVVLSGRIGEDGLAHDLSVAQSVGLGLDDKAMEAVKEWTFRPPLADLGGGIALRTQIRVDFRLPEKQSRWHLIRAEFHAPAEVSRPTFVNALYPIGAGIGPEAMEEGRILVAVGRMASAKLRFDVDEHGLPVNFQVQNASEALWGSEATAVVGQWRFTPGTKNGIPFSVPCEVELVWGNRKLTSDLERQLHNVLTPR
jgi:TonB family protein